MAHARSQQRHRAAGSKRSTRREPRSLRLPLIMLFTIGSATRPAAYFAREGCGGRWYLVGDDLRPESEIRAFDWERDGTIRF